MPAAAQLLLRPASAERCLRATCMALGIMPQPLAPQQTSLVALNRSLGDDGSGFVVIDLAAVPELAPHPLALATLLPVPQTRARVFLLRQGPGPVWAQDRAWVRSLGFADLLAEPDASALCGEAYAQVERFASLAGATLKPADEIARYLSAMAAKPDPTSPRGLIRLRTGLSAEALGQLLSEKVAIKDRSYRFKNYAQCFLGNEATTWLSTQYQLTRPDAVALGQALQNLGLIFHVVHEQPFADAEFFYRSSVQPEAQRLDLSDLLQTLKGTEGVAVRDRRYLDTVYPQCFIGSEAVDWAVKRYALERHQAEVALNRLHHFGLIAHVLREHPVRDGNFYYRFN